MGPETPLQTLGRAHEEGLRRLAYLEEAMDKLRKGISPFRDENLGFVLDFFDGELRVHFYHEEQGLFPIMERYIGRAGPIAVMLDEHQSLWRAVDTFKEKLQRLKDVQGEDASLGLQVAQLGEHILGFLHSHIEKEDRVLFPLAARVLTPGQWEEVSHQMAEAEDFMLSSR